MIAAQRDINLGGSYFPTNFAALAQDPALAPVRKFKGVTLYRVRQSPLVGVSPTSGQSGSELAGCA